MEAVNESFQWARSLPKLANPNSCKAGQICPQILITFVTAKDKDSGT